MIVDARSARPVRAGTGTDTYPLRTPPCNPGPQRATLAVVRAPRGGSAAPPRESRSLAARRGALDPALATALWRLVVVMWLLALSLAAVALHERQVAHETAPAGPAPDAACTAMDQAARVGRDGGPTCAP